MPIEIRRFGIGNRRPSGPPGSSGVSGGVIHGDASGVVTELAFSRGGRIEPHANPSACWFLVIEGGGWVQVGDERARVAAGDAVSWPPDIDHSAWTEYGEMRAILVELAAGRADGVVDGHAVALLDAGEPAEDAGEPAESAGEPAESAGEPAESAGPSSVLADGALREDPGHSAASYDPAEGEPR
jgi:quercetin dioxygenase-like cupin family protein